MAVDVATFLISPLDDNSLMMISVTLAEVAGGFMAFGQASLSVPPQGLQGTTQAPELEKNLFRKSGRCVFTLRNKVHHSRPYHTVRSLTTCKYTPISFGFTMHGIPIETYVPAVT